MPSTFAGIELASRALRVNQRAIDVIGHNVANVNTPGYTRQTYDLAATDPYTVPSFVRPSGPLQIGTGVDLTSIRRVRDGFIEQQLQLAAGEQGELNQLRDLLGRVESLYNEPGEDGLNSALTAFFNAFQELSRNPESGGIRATVRQEGRNLARQFARLTGALAQLQEEIAGRVQNTVTQANNLGRQIAALNRAIRSSLAVGDNPNDLQDRRDTLVRQLSELVGGQVVAETDASGRATGALNISVGTFALVLGTSSFSLPSQITTLAGTPHLTDGQNSTPVTRGAVAGLMRVSALIDGYRADLDAIASTLIARVNQQHQSGYGLDNSTGRAFFAGTDAASIAVDAAMEADLNAIAAATPPAAGDPVAPGNGDNARAIAGIARERLFGSFTLGDFYGSSVARIGADAQTYQERAANQETATQQLQNLRESLSGVSLDEELTQMLQHQRSYQAAARLLTTMDDILGTLIETVGR